MLRSLVRFQLAPLRNRWSSPMSLSKGVSRAASDTDPTRNRRWSGDVWGVMASRGLSWVQILEGWNNLYPGPVEGMEVLLARAACSIPLFAFTNSNPSHQAVWSTVIEQELRHFRQVFVSSEIGVRKPESKAFRIVAKAAGYPPARMLFFDDALVNVEGVRRAGMQAVHVCSIRDIHDALAALGLGEVR